MPDTKRKILCACFIAVCFFMGLVWPANAETKGGKVNANKQGIIAIIGIDYDEGDTSTYRGVTLHIAGREDVKITGKSPGQAYKAALKAARQAGAVKIMESSSVDSWINERERKWQGAKAQVKS